MTVRTRNWRSLFGETAGSPLRGRSIVSSGRPDSPDKLTESFLLELENMLPDVKAVDYGTMPGGARLR